MKNETLKGIKVCVITGIFAGILAILKNLGSVCYVLGMIYVITVEKIWEK